jgi:hypothetical protein
MRFICHYLDAFSIRVCSTLGCTGEIPGYLAISPGVMDGTLLKEGDFQLDGYLTKVEHTIKLQTSGKRKIILGFII